MKEEKEKESLPEIIVTVVSRDGETVVYPTTFEEHYIGVKGCWGDYQKWLGEYLEENYTEVVTYYDEYEDISVVVYKLKCQI